MPRIKVSVIIPAKNAGSTLSRAVTSAISQVGIEMVEIIVIDDGSTDDTSTLIQRDYPSVQLLHAGGVGVSAARNMGLDVAKGEYVAFLDADDEWKANKLAMQIAFLDQHADYVLCGTAAEYVDTLGHVIMVSGKALDGNVLKRLLCGNFIITSSAIARRDVIFRDRIRFNELSRVGEDWEFWLRLSSRGKVKLLVDPLLRYTFYQGSKYSIELRLASLVAMINNLKLDSHFMKAVGSNKCLLDFIPHLMKLRWVRHVRGSFAATIAGFRLFLDQPRLVINVILCLAAPLHP